LRWVVRAGLPADRLHTGRGGHLRFPAQGGPVCALLRQESGRRQCTV
ncbi:hypothetical protein pipiens_000040, partial [Culex pipiens pipiens]